MNKGPEVRTSGPLSLAGAGDSKSPASPRTVVRDGPADQATDFTVSAYSSIWSKFM